jgi:hypothetical protein
MVRGGGASAEGDEVFIAKLSDVRRSWSTAITSSMVGLHGNGSEK